MKTIENSTPDDAGQLHTRSLLATSASLLERLKNEDHPGDWESLYAKYHRPILYYAQKLGLKNQDAEDVLQETMVELMKALKRFDYDPRRGKFRNFVFTVTHRKCHKAFRKINRLPESKGAHSSLPDSERLELPADSTCPSDTLADTDDRDWKLCLIVECLERLRQDKATRPETIEIFVAYAIQGQCPAEVAERFNTNKNRVIQIKNRTIRRLQREVAQLTSEDEETED